jgi:murein DD-endopeptidase MepM/ murein hydrolase activator NlpD
MNNDNDEDSYSLRKKILKSICIFYLIVIAIVCIVSSNFSSCYKYSFNEETIGYYCNQTEYDNDISNLIETKEKENDSEVITTYYIIENPTIEKVYISNYKIKEVNNNNYNILNNYIIEDYTVFKLIINNSTILYFKTEEEANKVKEEIESKTSNVTIELKQEIVKELPIFYTEEDKNSIIENNKKEVTSRQGTRTTTSTTNKSSKIIAQYTYISQYFKGQLPAHSGVDFAAPYGTEVYAWKNGVVTQACWNGNYGNFISIQNDDGTIIRYGHLSSYNCQEGDTVGARTMCRLCW